MKAIMENSAALNTKIAARTFSVTLKPFSQIKKGDLVYLQGEILQAAEDAGCIQPEDGSEKVRYFRFTRKNKNYWCYECFFPEGPVPIVSGIGLLVTLLRVRRDGMDTDFWYDPFLVNVPGEPADRELLTLFQKTVWAFLDTPQGREAAEETCNDFNWGDTLNYIPYSFWASRGIYPLSQADPVFLCRGARVLCVNQDETFSG